MNEQIKYILDNITKHKNQMILYENALKAVRAICKHEWEYDGHGHNRDYYTCSKCLDTKSE